MDVLHMDAVLEERSHGLGRVSSVAAAERCHEEGKFRVLPGIVYKAAEGRADLIGADVGADSRDGVGLTLRTFGDTHPGTEPLDGLQRSSTVVKPLVVASEDEHLVPV